jgi:hypothetical protein
MNLEDYIDSLRNYQVWDGDSGVDSGVSTDSLTCKIKGLFSTIQNHVAQFESLYLAINTLLLALIYFELRRK